MADRGARRPRASQLALLRRPDVQKALEVAAAACIFDGDGCTDPGACDHDDNRMSPLEWIAWLRLYLEPPSDPRLGATGQPLSQDRRARWARKDRAKRELNVAV